MLIGRFKLLAAAWLCAGATAAHASIGPEIGLSCSQALSISDVGGLQVGCAGDLRVFGNGPEAVLSHPEAIVLRASASLRLDDLRIVSPRITLDASELLVSPGAHLDAGGAGPVGHSGPLTLRVGGEVRLGAGLDPNRVSVVSTTAGGSIALAGFQLSGVISGSRFDAGMLGSSHLGGRVSGAFFGPVGASPGAIDLTSPGQLDTPGAGRYAAPFLLLKPGASALSPVPEPSTWVLLLAGLGLVAFAHRRRA